MILQKHARKWILHEQAGTSAPAGHNDGGVFLLFHLCLAETTFVDWLIDRPPTVPLCRRPWGVFRQEQADREPFHADWLATVSRNKKTKRNQNGG